MSACRYAPLDATLERPWVRVLIRLQRMDWVTLDDLLLALEPADHEAQTYRCAVLSSVTAGRVDRDRSRRPYMYRITAAGRKALRDALSMGDVA